MIQQNYITVICWGQETIFPATASRGKIIFNCHFKPAGASLSQQFSIFMKMASNNPNNVDGNGMEDWDKESHTKAKLIEEIKNHPCINNKTDLNHYCWDKRLEIFNNTGRMLGMDGKQLHN